MKTVSVFLLRMIETRGTRQSFACLLYHPRNIACLVTNTFVSLTSYMLTSSSSNTVMYLASPVLGMLRREILAVDGTMWMSFAGCWMFQGNSLMVSAAVRVPSGSWKILSDACPVGRNAGVSFFAPTFDVVALSATMDGMVPLRTPLLIDASDIQLIVSSFIDICSSTWQSGGVVSANIP